MSNYKTYVGTKIIKAMPCNENEFKKDSNEESAGREGYAVKYPDGYTSWSPKEAFESAYRLITDGEKNLI